MTALDYDLEFLEDGRTIELISVALVAEDGRSYYAVNRDLAAWTWRGWRLRHRIRRHAWLMEHVVPNLPKALGDRRLTMPKRWLFDYAAPEVKSPARIAAEVAAFIQATPDVELWANYGAYDHVCLAQLWGPMIALPAGVPMFTHDIQQERDRLGLTWNDLPEQAGGAHNALADARHNQVVRRWLAEHAKAVTP